jgi:hypothetical protein
VNLEDLNHYDLKQANIELLKCCGSDQWTEKILAIIISDKNVLNKNKVLTKIIKMVF